MRKWFHNYFSKCQPIEIATLLREFFNNFFKLIFVTANLFSGSIRDISPEPSDPPVNRLDIKLYCRILNKSGYRRIITNLLLLNHVVVE